MELAMTLASATLCQGLCSILSAVGRKGEGHGKVTRAGSLLSRSD